MKLESNNFSHEIRLFPDSDEEKYLLEDCFISKKEIRSRILKKVIYASFSHTYIPKNKKIILVKKLEKLKKETQKYFELKKELAERGYTQIIQNSFVKQLECGNFSVIVFDCGNIKEFVMENPNKFEVHKIRINVFIEGIKKDLLTKLEDNKEILKDIENNYSFAQNLIYYYVNEQLHPSNEREEDMLEFIKKNLK